MSKNRKRQQLNKKIGKALEHAELDREFQPKHMSTNELAELWETIKNEIGEPSICTKNKYGFSDYTPYNAITGNELISKPSLMDPKTKLSSGYNSAKK